MQSLNEERARLLFLALCLKPNKRRTIRKIQQLFLFTLVCIFHSLQSEFLEWASVCYTGDFARSVLEQSRVNLARLSTGERGNTSTDILLALSQIFTGYKA